MRSKQTFKGIKCEVIDVERIIILLLFTIGNYFVVIYLSDLGPSPEDLIILLQFCFVFYNVFGFPNFFSVDAFKKNQLIFLVDTMSARLYVCIIKC